MGCCGSKQRTPQAENINGYSSDMLTSTQTQQHHHHHHQDQEYHHVVQKVYVPVTTPPQTRHQPQPQPQPQPPPLIPSSVTPTLASNNPLRVPETILEKPFEDIKQHYRLGKELGRGQFGITYLCTENSTGQTYACKSILKRKLTSKQDREDVKREIQIMQHLSGQQNIVEFRGAYEDRQSVHLVMELCAGGELFDRIIAQGHYSERAAAAICRSVVNVVHICHFMGVMHRDLKPENFLLSSKDEGAMLKATDFGLSVFIEEGKTYRDIVGSAYYVAPEVLQRSYGKEIDIWSAGIILYILLSGVPPFWAETEKGIFDPTAQFINRTSSSSNRKPRKVKRKHPFMAFLLPSLLKTLAATSFLLSLLLLQPSLITAHGGGDDDHDPEADEHVNLREKSLILVKVWCLIILLVSTFAAGVSPYFCRWNESFLLLGTQFAGGVFLATSLIHFLSDSNETFADLVTDVDYPFAFMLASAGYLLTMLGDCVVDLVAKGGGREREVAVATVGVEESGVGKEMGGVNDHNGLLLRTRSLGDTVLLISALCFHSVFEGIAVGVSGSKSEAWRNLWTISLHKIFAAIAMGIALLKILPKRPLVLTSAYSFAFAVSSPIGVGIGIAIDATTEGQAADWTYAISMGFACGVFIYVAINHLISKGFKPQSECKFDTPFFKFLAVLLGVAVIAVVMIWD